MCGGGDKESGILPTRRRRAPSRRDGRTIRSLSLVLVTYVKKNWHRQDAKRRGQNGANKINSSKSPDSRIVIHESTGRAQPGAARRHVGFDDARCRQLTTGNSTANEWIVKGRSELSGSRGCRRDELFDNDNQPGCHVTRVERHWSFPDLWQVTPVTISELIETIDTLASSEEPHNLQTLYNNV